MYEATYDPDISPATDVTSVADLPSVACYVLGALYELGDGWHREETVVRRTEALFRTVKTEVDYDNSELWTWAVDALAEAGYLERREDAYRLVFDRERVGDVLVSDWEPGRHLDR
jgi:hypothetical protein